MPCEVSLPSPSTRRISAVKGAALRKYTFSKEDEKPGLLLETRPLAVGHRGSPAEKGGMRGRGAYGPVRKS